VGEVRCHVLSAASRRAPCLEWCQHISSISEVVSGGQVPGDDYNSRTLGHGR
jgi:hypothetical protein